MTLNITVVAPWGIWQCSDHRLSRVRDGRVEHYEDTSMKHLSIRGLDGTALITYTGLGTFENVHVSDWMRQLLRGQSWTVAEALNFLCEQATLTLAPIALKYNIYHIFSVGVFMAGRPWFVIISNTQPVADYPNYPPLDEFALYPTYVGEENAICFVTGTKQAINENDYQLLAHIAQNRPSRQTDYQMVLANINRRASQHKIHGWPISPDCITCFLSTTGAPGSQQMHHWDPAKPLLYKPIPQLVFGIDLTEMMQVGLNRAKDVHQGIETEATTNINQHLEEAAKRAIRTRPPKE